MIELEKYESALRECLLNETGLPFNRWIHQTRSELAQESIDKVNYLNREIELHKNELVIDMSKIVRLVDVVDGNEDFYWMYDEWLGMFNSNQYLSSCVGQHIRLKGYLPDEEYERLVRVWNINQVEKAV